MCIYIYMYVMISLVRLSLCLVSVWIWFIFYLFLATNIIFLGIDWVLSEWSAHHVDLNRQSFQHWTSTPKRSGIRIRSTKWTDIDIDIDIDAYRFLSLYIYVYIWFSLSHKITENIYIYIEMKKRMTIKKFWNESESK